MMWKRRTDLAAERIALAQEEQTALGQLRGVRTQEREFAGFSITEVEILDAVGARRLGKPCGRYVTLALPQEKLTEAFDDAVAVLAAELHDLLPPRAKNLLVLGLGNAALTADAIGPLAVRHIVPTRHLPHLPFPSSLSVHATEVVGKTGIEAAEQARALRRAIGAEGVILIDALAARSVERLCTTVQLSSNGLVPGSGIGAHRLAIDEAALGVPVISMGIPTVVESATLALDLLQEAGVALPDAALRQGFFVTPKEIDERVQQLARLLGWSINAAVLGLSAAQSAALLG